MGLRVKLGGGWSVGQSGLRYGRRIGGTYVNTGRSGTLLANGRLRYWAPAKHPRTRSGSYQCQGITQKGTQCRNNAAFSVSRSSDGMVVGYICRRHDTDAIRSALVLHQNNLDFEAEQQAEAEERARQEACFVSVGAATSSDVTRKIDKLLSTAESYRSIGNHEAASSYEEKAEDLRSIHWPSEEVASVWNMSAIWNCVYLVVMVLAIGFIITSL